MVHIGALDKQARQPKTRNPAGNKPAVRLRRLRLPSEHGGPTCWRADPARTGDRKSVPCVCKRNAANAPQNALPQRRQDLFPQQRIQQRNPVV